MDEQRARTGSENVAFLNCKVKALVTVLGHDLAISRFRDSTLSWRYIHERRVMKAGKRNVSDRCIRRELGVLRMALAIAKSQGLWAGDLDIIVPPNFCPPPAPKGDRIGRPEARRLFPLLGPDAAAALAFILATGAEMSAVGNALKADIPEDLVTCSSVLVRGTKNANRWAPVPIVTDEQRLLLAYAQKHACGKGEKLFRNPNGLLRALRDACKEEQLTVVSPHDIRRSAGQWLVDLGVPIELVSKFMRHADTRITETIYAEVKRADVADRILDAIDPRYARQAHHRRKKPVVETLKKIPEPKCTSPLYTVKGVSKTLTEWSRATGIAKPTLHHRVVTRGMSMAEAVALGRPNYSPRGRKTASLSSPVPTADCETGVKVSADGVAPNGQNACPPSDVTPQFPAEMTEKVARPVRFELTTFGFEGRRSIQLSYGRVCDVPQVYTRSGPSAMGDQAAGGRTACSRSEAAREPWRWSGRRMPSRPCTVRSGPCTIPPNTGGACIRALPRGRPRIGVRGMEALCELRVLTARHAEAGQPGEAGGIASSENHAPRG